MTREEKSNLLNELLEIEEKNDIGNLTRAERREFQQWVEDLEQEPCEDATLKDIFCMGCEYKEQEPTTENDLGVDCISRKAAEDITWQDPSYTDPLNILTEVRDKIRELPSVTPQELFINKPCVSSGVCEHDKNKVLDKLRAEIETKYGQCDICEYFEDYDYEENDISEYRPIGNIADILQIIDKYKAESESEE